MTLNNFLITNKQTAVQMLYQVGMMYREWSTGTDMLNRKSLNSSC